MDRNCKSMIGDIVSVLDRSAEHTAFVIRGAEYSYRNLKDMVRSIMVHLPSGEKRIGIIGEDDIHTYAAILAVLVSGNTYVILHPSYPVERNRKIMAASEISLVLGVGPEPDCIGDLNYMSTDGLPVPGKPDELEVRGTPESFAYIIFTSGSTGEPKGVPVSRGNLDAFYKAYSSLDWNIGEDDRVLQMFELTFDVSVASFLYPLTVGASVFTAGHRDVKHFKVITLLEDHAVTFASVTPSLLHLLSPYFEEISLPELKYLAVTAEACPAELLSRFRQCAPDATFVNLYGPTEVTIWSTCYRVPPSGVKEYNGMTAIGKPFPATDAAIINEQGDILPSGEQGELLLAGPQVMQGYLDAPEKTREAMVELYPGRYYYRTGDLCILDEEGDILYCGRKDQQVKLQGFRIELSEIEQVTKKYLDHTRGVVALVYDESGTGPSLGLAIEGTYMTEQELRKLKAHLQKQLPYYMIPRKIQFIPKFPINNSNKIDRKKIHELFQ